MTNRLHHSQRVAAARAGFAAGDWVETGANLIAIGNSGAGKTHVLCAIGHALVEAGKRVLYPDRTLTCTLKGNPTSRQCHGTLEIVRHQFSLWKFPTTGRSHGAKDALGVRRAWERLSCAAR